MTTWRRSSDARWTTRIAGWPAPLGPDGGVALTDEAFDHLVSLAGGDARSALNVLEGAAALAETEGVRDADGRVSPTLADVEAAAQQRVLAYDRAGDGHYDTASAFIKSLRGNDPDAALYWLAAMIAAGEDPKFIARRLIISASEDVGNADPRALQVAVAAGQALDWIGLPEAQYALAQATTYIATAPEVEPVRPGLLGRGLGRGGEWRTARPAPPPQRRPSRHEAARHRRRVSLLARLRGRRRRPAVPARCPRRPALLPAHGPGLRGDARRPDDRAFRSPGRREGRRPNASLDDGRAGGQTPLRRLDHEDPRDQPEEARRHREARRRRSSPRDGGRIVERPDVRYARAADGAYIAFQAFGAGRYDIVFMPGQFTHLDLSWDDPEEAAWFRRLATLGRVIMLDRRGIGLSDRFAPDMAPPIEVLVEDLGAVMDAAGATKPILFGTAVGAQLASLFAASHPDRVRGLATYAMWSHLSEAESDDWRSYVEWTLAHIGSIEAAQNEVRDMQPSRADDPDRVAWVARFTRSAFSPGSFRPMMEVQIALDIRDILPTITVPSLAMYRVGDSTIPGPGSMRRAAELFNGATIVELPGTDHWWSAEPVTPIIDALEAFIAGLDGANVRPDRRLSTVLFTDIVGSTARAAGLGDSAWRDLIGAHHAVVRRELTRFMGTEVDTAGDGFFASFDGPARAVRCAQAIATRVRELGLEIRAGVHTGEIETIDGKIGGIAVIIGARIGAMAGPSDIMVSSTVKDLTAGSGLVFEDAGEHVLKGVPEPWHLYRVAH